MAIQPGPINLSYGWAANADLSASQFKFVKLTAGKVTVCNAAGDFAVGVLINKPTAADQMADVVIFGPTKVVAGGAITAGNLVTTDNAGKAVAINPTSGADYDKAILGRAMHDVAADGDICGVWVNCINPGPAKEAHS